MEMYVVGIASMTGVGTEWFVQFVCFTLMTGVVN